MVSSRAPQGARGLKFFNAREWQAVNASRPARGAWVEISTAVPPERITCGRAPQGARGLKYRPLHHVQQHLRSRPARGAWVETIIGRRSKAATASRLEGGVWVEIAALKMSAFVTAVAPRKGRVG